MIQSPLIFVFYIGTLSNTLEITTITSLYFTPSTVIINSPVCSYHFETRTVSTVCRAFTIPAAGKKRKKRDALPELKNAEPSIDSLDTSILPHDKEPRLGIINLSTYASTFSNTVYLTITEATISTSSTASTAFFTVTRTILSTIPDSIVNSSVGGTRPRC